ncbi:MAG TPA: oligopeptide/dipeptide ABC transporter ATP-binding protein, partial [Ilumatobacteraceae bacterium]
RSLRRSRELAIILITHDLGVVAGLADRVHVMYAGRIVESGPVVDIFHRPQHPYTAGLLASLPRLDRPEQELTPIGGVPPRLYEAPDGCAFAPRCQYAVDSCHVNDPMLRPVEESMVACSVLPFAARAAENVR